MSANSTQVGGSHYAASYQHWDFVVRSLHNRYLEGNITKYVARHKRKNGAEDLQKAIHYLDKLIEEAKAERVQPLMSSVSNDAEDFCAANGIEGIQRFAVLMVCSWEALEELHRARHWLADSLADYRATS